MALPSTAAAGTLRLVQLPLALLVPILILVPVLVLSALYLLVPVLILILSTRSARRIRHLLLLVEPTLLSLLLETTLHLLLTLLVEASPTLLLTLLVEAGLVEALLRLLLIETTLLLLVEPTLLLLLLPSLHVEALLPHAYLLLMLVKSSHLILLLSDCSELIHIQTPERSNLPHLTHLTDSDTHLVYAHGVHLRVLLQLVLKVLELALVEVDVNSLLLLLLVIHHTAHALHLLISNTNGAQLVQLPEHVGLLLSTNTDHLILVLSTNTKRTESNRPQLRVLLHLINVLLRHTAQRA